MASSLDSGRGVICRKTLIRGVEYFCRGYRSLRRHRRPHFKHALDMPRQVRVSILSLVDFVVVCCMIWRTCIGSIRALIDIFVARCIIALAKVAMSIVCLYIYLGFSCVIRPRDTYRRTTLRRLVVVYFVSIIQLFLRCNFIAILYLGAVNITNFTPIRFSWKTSPTVLRKL